MAKLELFLHAIFLLVVLYVATTQGCPTGCTCGPYRGQPTQVQVDCQGRGLNSIPQGYVRA